MGTTEKLLHDLEAHHEHVWQPWFASPSLAPHHATLTRTLRHTHTHTADHTEPHLPQSAQNKGVVLSESEQIVSRSVKREKDTYSIMQEDKDWEATRQAAPTGKSIQQDAAHEPECSHLEHVCETSYSNSLVHFARYRTNTSAL